MIVKKGILKLTANAGPQKHEQILTIYEKTVGKYVEYLVQHTTSTLKDDAGNILSNGEPQKDFTAYIDKTIDEIVLIYSIMIHGDNKEWISPLTEVI